MAGRRFFKGSHPRLTGRPYGGGEPRALEYKFYARGIGPVLEIGISGDTDRADLVRFRRGRG